MLTSNNSILKQATGSKTQTEIREEKEIVNLSSMQVASKETLEDRNKLNHDEMKEIVTNNARGLEFELLDDDDGYIVEFTKRKRFYKIYDNGKIEEIELVKDNTPGDITKDKDGNILDGTTKLYEIWSIEDLVAFTKSINEGNKFQGLTITLMKNLDFNSKLSYANSKTTEFEDYLGGDGTVELKTQLLKDGLGFKSVSKNFNGIFEGNDNKIEGLYINTTDLSRGAFCGTNNGTIKNLNIVDFDINVGFGSGIICGSNKGDIENINISGQIVCTATSAGTISIGSVCSGNSGNIKNSYYRRKLNYDLQMSSSTGTFVNSGEKTEEEMLNDSFLNDLNAGATDENKMFVKDTNNINQGYPILKWQQ